MIEAVLLHSGHSQTTTEMLAAIVAVLLWLPALAVFLVISLRRRLRTRAETLKPFGAEVELDGDFRTNSAKGA